ncbi:HlyD family secretion protein [Dongia rigui]|uniref:HlyD family efflux transporter periplasmic adaptor subunit n=1 Tax=Dongia rigui TaxID=940149 RepID=A0ABU5DYE3_9PROT|nr:HlyD family efflux transporter periplasmic adaptor subunit [Dongia rigui]MDY0871940.1 HlyD family efflux transporter periplasmic adaptor subunit [Dongia rigui]
MRVTRSCLGASLIAVTLMGCDKPADDRLLGYVEGDYVYMALPSAGRLAEIAVKRGDQVAAGDVLFRLDDTTAAADLARAKADLLEAEHKLADLKTGERPEELAIIEAQLASANASLMLSEPRVKRRRELVKSNIVGTEDLDSAEASILEDRGRIAEYTARLAAARLPGRDEQIAAQEAAVDAFRSAITTAQWALDERRAVAPAGGSIQDVYFRPGEEVAAEQAVLQLLPPENIKLKIYVPEPVIGHYQIGEELAVTCDGCPPDLTARIDFIAASAEYTPPVIYSDTSRAKLVFLVEARPVSAPAGFQWHPGQPVEARPLAPPQAASPAS